MLAILLQICCRCSNMQMAIQFMIGAGTGSGTRPATHWLGVFEDEIHPAQAGTDEVAIGGGPYADCASGADIVDPGGLALGARRRPAGRRRRESTAVVRQGPRHAPGRCDLLSQSQRVHRHQDRDGKHRCGLASAPGPQDARGGLSAIAEVPRAECAVDLPCVAGRLAIAVYRTS
jgi:hypothetical protein